MSYNVYGYNREISYCPRCENNDWTDTSGSVILYQESPIYYSCKCGWKGLQDELLNKKQISKKNRKNKLLKIEKYEN